MVHVVHIGGIYACIRTYKNAIDEEEKKRTEGALSLGQFAQPTDGAAVLD